MKQLLVIITAAILAIACSLTPNAPGTIVAVMPSTMPDHVLVVYQNNTGFGTVEAGKDQICVDEVGTIVLPFNYFRFYHKHAFGIFPKYKNNLQLREYLERHTG